MYIVTIPSDPSVKKEFGSLRASKKYARTLPTLAGSVDNKPIIYDNHMPARYIRLVNGQFCYLCAPDSWKN